MYMANGNDDVFALDATTGATIWTHRSSMAPNLTNICCGWDARGLAIGDHRVFVAQLDGKLLALDQHDRRRDVVGDERSLPGGLHDDDGAAVLQGPRHRRHLRLRAGRARFRDRI